MANQKKLAVNNGAANKEMEKLKTERDQTCVERDRLQQQLEMLVSELEKSQVRIICLTLNRRIH